MESSCTLHRVYVVLDSSTQRLPSEHSRFGLKSLEDTWTSWDACVQRAGGRATDPLKWFRLYVLQGGPAELTPACTFL